MKKFSRPRALIFGMKHLLVNLYQVRSNYIPGAKNGLPQGSHVLHRHIKGKHEKVFLSETTRPRALIFGMKHHLVNLNHVCSNYAKSGPAPGVTRDMVSFQQIPICKLLTKLR